MVRENRGVIMNLNFKDCRFTTTSNSEAILFSMTSGYQTSSGQVLNCSAINCIVQSNSTIYEIEAQPEEGFIVYAPSDVIE